jgi:MFS family permease
MTALAATARRMFSSLQVHNYRLYLGGQAVSLSGTWMQSVAQGWLVLELTGSGTAIGLVLALQFLPVLFFGPLGGVIADRFDKRHILLVTQAAAGTLATTLGLLVLSDVVRLWMVYVLATGLGFVNLVDNPTRQTFIFEMVGPHQLTNAVSLHSVLVNVARVVGPAVAGALILTLGMAPCFLINGASYLAVIIALAAMRVTELRPGPRQPRRRGQLREGLRYVRTTPALFTPLLMMAVIGTLTYEFQVILPLLARFTFGGDAGTYSTMTACMGAGAVVGGLLTAAAGRRRPTALALAAIAFGAVQIAAAWAPHLWVALGLLVLVGAASISFLSLGNATLQLASAPEMRGRVMALWAVAFMGTTPVGGPLIGWIAERLGPRYGLGIGGLAALLSGLLAYRILARRAGTPRPAPSAPEIEVPPGSLTPR